MNALVKVDEELSKPQNLELIKRTVAKDCDMNEFNVFIETARALRLSPIRRQIYAFVFNKDDQKKRQLTIVTAIGGYRSIASRTGNYRPGPSECHIVETLKNPESNPEGIEYGEATVYLFSHNEWHAVTERAYWSEYAPLYDGKLDKYKPNWRRMARTMIEKCAEAKALRRAWPDDFAGVYSEEEIDRQHSLDALPSEAVAEAETAAKLALAGGADALTVDFGGRTLERVPLGSFADRLLAFGADKSLSAVDMRIFWDRNLPARIEFKARKPGDYLELQKAWEALTDQREKEDAAT